MAKPFVRRHLSAFAQTSAALLTLVAATVPVAAQPGQGQALADAIVAACTPLTWTDLQIGTNPAANACRDAATGNFAAAIALSPEDQERVGAAFATAMRAPVEAGAPMAFHAASYMSALAFQGGLYEYCLPGGNPGITATLETCSAAVRIVAVASQAQAPDLLSIHVQDVCSALTQEAAWRPDLQAILAGLATRGATGTDPIMTGNIDGLVTGIAGACP